MKASATQEEPRITPHRASWRAVKDELASVGAELSRLRAEKEVDRALIEAQDARLAKAGADLEECKRLASSLITDICIEKEARAVAERIASERAAEVQRLELVLTLEREARQMSEDRLKEEAAIHMDPEAIGSPANIAMLLAEDVERLRARVHELEPLAAVGRSMLALPVSHAIARRAAGYSLHRWACEGCSSLVGDGECEECGSVGDGVWHEIATASTVPAALRAAGIGEAP